MPNKKEIIRFLNEFNDRFLTLNNFQLLNRKVHIEWHKHKWYKTLLGLEQINLIAFRFFLYCLLIPKKVNDSFHRAQRILSKHCTPTQGGVLLPKVKHHHLRKTPDKGLADVLTYWVSDLLNSSFKTPVELMLTLSFIFGAIAFWENAPRLLLEVDPSLILDPSRLHLLREVIIHEGSEPLDEGLICTCIEFQQQSGMTTDAMRAQNRTLALAITVTSSVIVLMLNSVASSPIVVTSHGLA